MHFRVEHTFRNVTASEYEKIYWDEVFNEALCRAVNLERQLKSREERDGRIYREVVVGPNREIPKPLAKILGKSKIEYTEISDYKFGSFEGTWKTIPSIMPDKVVSNGTFKYQEVNGGVRRVVEGNITVKVLGVGGVVEKFIVSDVEKSYDDAAAFTQQWIDEGRHKG